MWRSMYLKFQKTTATSYLLHYFFPAILLILQRLAVCIIGFFWTLCTLSAKILLSCVVQWQPTRFSVMIIGHITNIMLLWTVWCHGHFTFQYFIHVSLSDRIQKNIAQFFFKVKYCAVYQKRSDN